MEGERLRVASIANFDVEIPIASIAMSTSPFGSLSKAHQAASNLHDSATLPMTLSVAECGLSAESSERWGKSA